MTRRRIAIFGGTFDPVHVGHLRMAKELEAHFQLDEMRLVPCHIPPHREQPVASSAQRLDMLRAALTGYPELSIDTLELGKTEPSYSLHTLQALRKTLGQDVSLSLAVGLDSLVNLDKWYQWQALLDYAHIIVAARPGWQLPASGALFDYINAHRGTVADVQQLSNGKIVLAELSLLDISATSIRQRLQQGRDVSDLVPAAVCEYLHTSSIYASHDVKPL